jgi:hypothetical protein
MQPPKADMTEEITEILGIEENQTRRMLNSGDRDWAGSAFDLLADKHHCDMGDVRVEMRRAIEASSRANSALSMVEELFFNDWPELVLKYSLDSVTKTEITSVDLDEWESMSALSMGLGKKTSETSHTHVSLPSSNSTIFTTIFEVEPEAIPEPFTLLFDKDDHPDLKSCTSVGEFAHYILKRATGGLNESDEDFENFAFDDNGLDTVSIATTVKTGIMSSMAFQDMKTRRKLDKQLRSEFADNLMMDVLGEEDDLGQEVSFFDYIGPSIEGEIQKLKSDVRSMDWSEIMEETKPPSEFHSENGSELETKSDNLSNFSQNNTKNLKKKVSAHSIHSQNTKKSIKLRPSKQKLLLDMGIDEYVVPDLSYWFEDEWEEICERNSLFMPKLNEITARAKQSMKSLNLKPNTSTHSVKPEHDDLNVPLYRAVNFVNNIEQSIEQHNKL